MKISSFITTFLLLGAVCSCSAPKSGDGVLWLISKFTNGCDTIKD